MMSFQKIYALYGLEHHTVEIMVGRRRRCHYGDEQTNKMVIFKHVVKGRKWSPRVSKVQGGDEL